MFYFTFMFSGLTIIMMAFLALIFSPLAVGLFGGVMFGFIINELINLQGV